MFLSEAKVTLTGQLSVINRYCSCCNNRDMVNLLDDEGSPMYYCSKCFSTNCFCGGSKIWTEQK